MFSLSKIVAEASLACALIVCPSADEPPPSFRSIGEIADELIPPSYAPYIDEETATIERLKLGYEREISDNKAEIKRLKKENKRLEKESRAKRSEVSSVSSRNITSDNSEINVENTKGATFNATYYSAYCPTCGEWGGITATGDDISSSIYVRGKRVIAVDPNVIPLNTLVRVTTPNETFEALALDTGGAIKGNRVDILVESTEKAYSLGRHVVKVEVLN